MGRRNIRDLESIGRFSRRARIPVSQLRHYHEVGLLQPAYVDPESGYRYYAAAQSEAAEVIAILHSMDMPIRDIQRVLSDPSEATVREVLAKHREWLERRLSEAAGRLEAIDRIVKEGIFVKQPSPSAGEGFVPVSIEQVRAHVPSAERWQELCAKLPRQCGEEPQEVHVVVLAAESGRRLPIWVGRFEADAIRLHLDGLKTERPLTYDLMLDVLNRHAINMVRAEVLRMADGVFFAQIVTKSNGRVETLSCRPSDALNLALRANVAITVAGTLLDDVGVDAGSDIK